MEVFTSYSNPKKGIFNVETHEYKFPVGWVQKPVEAMIIGETALTYVTEIRTVEFGRWEGAKVINYQERIYLGFHKSRLQYWLNHQLDLFDQ